MFLEGNLELDTSRQQSFLELHAETRIIELKLQQYFKNRGYHIIDKSDDVLSREKDIDFEIIMQGYHDLNVEVKADKQMYKTGNILVELAHNRPRKGRTKGWYQYCEADLICYHDTVNNVGYMLDWKKMKPLIYENYRVMGFNNPHDIGTRTNGFLIPVKEALANNWVVEQYRL